MSPEEFKQIQETIQSTVGAAIQTHVNGKIDKINTKLDTYIKEDNEWKERANPTIELGNNVRGFGKVFAYLLGIAGGIFGLFKYLTK